jgi:hypothetical protein
MYNKAELIKMFVEAHEQGFVKNLSTCECNQECETCPARAACIQLSEGGYKAFVTNYNMLMEGDYNA